jgi:hypothetical protein
MRHFANYQSNSSVRYLSTIVYYLCSFQFPDNVIQIELTNVLEALLCSTLKVVGSFSWLA